MLDKPILVTLPRPAGVALFFFPRRRRHTRCYRDWSSDVRSSDLSCASARVSATIAPLIVNISSGTPFRGVPFLLHYVTSKGAIVALTRALAKELGRDDVLVNCVAPGFTMSDGVREHPEVIDALREVSVSARTLQRDQEPEDVVGAVVFLCGPGATFVTGQTIVIDGGQYFH